MPSTPPYQSPESSSKPTDAGAVAPPDTAPISVSPEATPSDIIPPPEFPLPPCIASYIEPRTEDEDCFTMKVDEEGENGGEGGCENSLLPNVGIEEDSSVAADVGEVTDHYLMENERKEGEEAILEYAAQRDAKCSQVEADAEDIDGVEMDETRGQEANAASNDWAEMDEKFGREVGVATDADVVTSAGTNAEDTRTVSGVAEETVALETCVPTDDAKEQSCAPGDLKEAKEPDFNVAPTGSESEVLLQARCEELAAENDVLYRRVARLRQRLHAALDTAQTHGQRLLRAAFQEKVKELTTEHTVKTTEMLNMQKKCFEEELEAMGMDSQMALREVQRELEVERGLRRESEERYRKEREVTLEKTTATMVAVQRKLAQLHARATRLEREKKSLAGAVAEKQVMIEVLASAAAAKDVERRRVELLSRTREEERIRKEGVVERLEVEIRGLREMLAQERKVNANLVARIQEIEGDHGGSEKEVKEGKVFDGVGQDFVNVQSDVSTGE